MKEQLPRDHAAEGKETTVGAYSDEDKDGKGNNILVATQLLINGDSTEKQEKREKHPKSRHGRTLYAVITACQEEKGNVNLASDTRNDSQELRNHRRYATVLDDVSKIK